MPSKLNITLRIPVEDAAELVQASLDLRGSGYRLSTIVRLALLQYCEDLRSYNPLPSWTQTTAEAFLAEQNMLKGGKKTKTP